MSNTLALAAITAALKELLEDVLPDSSIVSATVTAQAPDLIKTEGNGQPQINLFLYRVTPNSGWANMGLPARDARGQRTANPPLALDLHYLLTAYASKDFQAEILLGYAMQCLHQWSVLPRNKLREMQDDWQKDTGKDAALKNALATSNLADQVEGIKICPEGIGVEGLSNLWSAFQANYRPTAAYQVSVALIESALPARSALPVLKRGKGDLGWDSVSGGIPQIEQIILPPDDEPLKEITLKGRNLVADRFTVKLKDKEVTFGPENLPTVTSAGDLQLKIPEDLPAGIIPVSVRTGRGLTSNTVPFVLRPTTKNLDVTGKTVTFTIEPQVQPGQHGLLLLNELKDEQDPQTRHTYSIALPLEQVATGSFTFELTEEVQPGNYLARVQIDGAESRYSPDPSDQEPEPQDQSDQEPPYPWPQVKVG